MEGGGEGLLSGTENVPQVSDQPFGLVLSFMEHEEGRGKRRAREQTSDCHKSPTAL